MVHWCGKASKINKDDAKTIQDEKDVQMEVPNAAAEKGLNEIVVDTEKEYVVFLIKSTFEAFVDFPITCGREWSWFVDFICKSIIDEASEGMKGWMDLVLA